MFSSWDLVRPRFWYPMSSLEQSMMELEHMAGLMTRSRFPFDAGSEMLAAPSNLDDDDFFRDLPVLAREQRPATQQRRVAAAQPQTQTQTQPKTQSDTTSARDNDPNKANSAKPTVDVKTMPSSSARGASGEQQTQHATERVGSNDADDNQQHHQRAFSSYSFSNSSIVDDKGRRVTSTRRRYEDSTGRLKAVHERQIEGNKLRTTWNRMGPDDDGRTEAVCSTGTPEEFEALWQQTPFGEAQKKTIKQQQQQQQQLEQGQQKQEHAPQAKSKSKADAEAESTPTPMEELGDQSNRPVQPKRLRNSSVWRTSSTTSRNQGGV